MFGRVGVTVCIAFIMLALVELSSANPVIGKKSKHFFVRIVFLIYILLFFAVGGMWEKINFDFISCDWFFFRMWCLQTTDSAGDFDMVGICLRNCAQCKKMYGSYFEGQMCADGCIKFKGKVIPGTSLIHLIGS